jgi:hypothetical protein
MGRRNYLLWLSSVPETTPADNLWNHLGNFQWTTVEKKKVWFSRRMTQHREKPGVSQATE